MQNRFNRKWLVPVVILLGIGIFLLPPVYSRVTPRLDSLQSSIKYLIKPPEDAVFQPATPVATSRIASTRTPLPTPSLASTSTQGPTLTPTITSTPLPASVTIKGFKYVDQKNRWNYCGPANLTMALNYLGWTGNRDDIAKIVVPGAHSYQRIHRHGSVPARPSRAPAGCRAGDHARSRGPAPECGQPVSADRQRIAQSLR